jgi:hypothetical protein
LEIWAEELQAWVDRFVSSTQTVNAARGDLVATRRASELLAFTAGDGGRKT